jgi:hypothetical protein
VTAVLLALALSGALETWRLEIEKTGPQQVHLVRMEPGAAIPPGTPNAEILAQFTENPNFQEQLGRAQALSISYLEAGGTQLGFMVVNPKQTGPDEEPYVIAHELGHLWLKAQRYPSPVYTGGRSSCLAIVAGDAVQHILIRREMNRRGIRWKESWVRTLEPALAAMEASKERGRPDRCRAITQVLLWMDVEEGLIDEEWPERRRFLGLLEQRFPVIQPAARELAEQLRGMDVADKGQHEAALRAVFTRLKELALTLPN